MIGALYTDTRCLAEVDSVYFGLLGNFAIALIVVPAAGCRYGDDWHESYMKWGGVFLARPHSQTSTDGGKPSKRSLEFVNDGIDDQPKFYCKRGTHECWSDCTLTKIHRGNLALPRNQ